MVLVVAGNNALSTVKLARSASASEGAVGYTVFDDASKMASGFLK